MTNLEGISMTQDLAFNRLAGNETYVCLVIRDTGDAKK